MIDRDSGGAEIVPPTYELSDEELQRLTDELIDMRTAEYSPEERFVSVVVNPQDPRSNVARHIERVVFEKRFKNNGAVELAEAYGPYESASTFFIVLDRQNRRPMSALRVIQNSPSGLMALNDLESEFHVSKENAIVMHGMDDLNTVLDIATVARMPDYKTELKAVTLAYRSMFVWAERHSIEHFVSMIHDGPHKRMTQYFGIPFSPLAGTPPGPYFGSEKTHPVYGKRSEFIEKMTRHMYFRPKGWLANKALQTMVKATNDNLLSLDDY